jgi:hypothetical protein
LNQHEFSAQPVDRFCGRRSRRYYVASLFLFLFSQVGGGEIDGKEANESEEIEEARESEREKIQEER